MNEGPMTPWRYNREKRSLYKLKKAEMIDAKEYFHKIRFLKKRYHEYLKGLEKNSQD